LAAQAKLKIVCNSEKKYKTWNGQFEEAPPPISSEAVLNEHLDCESSYECSFLNGYRMDKKSRTRRLTVIAAASMHGLLWPT